MIAMARRLLLLAALLLPTACTRFAPSPDATFVPSTIGFGYDEDAFDDAIAAAFDGRVRGYAAALVNADGIQATVSGGWAQAPGDGDVPMRTYIYSKIGSVSKMLSGIALLHLFDEHVLSDATVQEQLDMRIWPLLPQKWQDTYSGNIEGVTFRHLLQHRSGFRLTSDDQPGLPASATGHQMHYMISQDVAASDIGARLYNNFNFTILLYLIPAIAYPDTVAEIHEAFQDLDVVEYSKSITIFYGLLYERYMQEEIFPNALIPMTPTCRPIADLPADAYAKWYDGVSDPVGEIEDADFCRSQGSWYLTALELANFARTYAFSDNFIGPTTRASLFDPDDPDERLLYNFTLDYTGFELDQEEFAYHGGTQDEYRAALVELPYGYFGVALVNSAQLPGGGVLTSGDVARALIEAFDAAVDDSPPLVTATVTGTSSASGWYLGDVHVSWSVSDPDSEVSTSGCNDVTITTDTDAAGVTITCTATSLGGTTSDSVTVRRDATPPTVAVLGVQDGDAIAAADPPEVGCEAGDASPGSGVANASPAPTITELGGGFFSARCIAVDRAGNVASASVEYKLVSLDVIADEVAASGLNEGQKNSLLGMLEQARALLERDKIKQGVNAMAAFEHHVTSLLEEGELAVGEAQLLLDDIRVLIEYYG